MCDIDMYGHTFHSSEQAYQWKFTNYVGRHDLGEEILASTTPENAKEIASRVPRHMQKDWHSIKIGVMEEVLSQKITSCDEFKNSLINSGNERLVEAVKSDRYWSCGLNPKEASTTKSKYYPGENRFGLLLEHIRSTLIEKINTPNIVNHDTNLDTESTPDVSSPQPRTYYRPQSPSPPPHPSRTITSASLPSTIDAVKSDISASTSSKNSNTPLTTSLSETELTVDVLTVKPTINDRAPTIIPSSTSHTPHQAMSTTSTTTPKTKLYSHQRRRERYIIIYVCKILECKVPNISPPIRSRMSDRRGRSCVSSHVGVRRLGTLAYRRIIALDGVPSVCLTNYLCFYVIQLYVLLIVSKRNLIYIYLQCLIFHAIRDLTTSWTMETV